MTTYATTAKKKMTFKTTWIQAKKITPITRAESYKRLKMIERKTRQVRPERFHFAQWAGTNWQGKPDLSCGTNACSIGWATTIPYLRKHGLHLTLSTEYGTEGRPWPTVLSGVHNNENHNDSILDFLGLTEEEFDYLFVPFNGKDTALPTSATNIEVADRLQGFLRFRFPEFSKNPGWPTLKH
jgi:hypothetical protein